MVFVPGCKNTLPMIEAASKPVVAMQQNANFESLVFNAIREVESRSVKRTPTLGGKS